MNGIKNYSIHKIPANLVGSGNFKLFPYLHTNSQDGGKINILGCIFKTLSDFKRRKTLLVLYWRKNIKNKITAIIALNNKYNSKGDVQW
jgi:hypothetical protein